MTPFQRAIGAIAVTIIVGAGAAAGVFIAQTGGAPPPPPSAAVQMSPSGNDATCTRAVPPVNSCLTAQKAYTLAQPGDTVTVLAGQYPPQNLAFDATKTTTPVTFQGASGANVIWGAHTTTTADINMITGSTIPVVSTAGFVGPTYKVRVGRSLYSCTGSDATDFTSCTAGPACGAPPSGSGQLCGWLSGSDVVDNSGALGGGLNITGADNLVFRNIQNVQGIFMGSGSANITLDNVNARFGDFGASNVTWINSNDIGNYNGSFAMQIHGDALTFRDDTIHNLTLTHCGGSITGNSNNTYCHGDGVFVSCSTNLTFDRVAFQNNSVFHIFGSHGPCSTQFSSVGNNPGPVTIQNSSFGTLDSPSAAVSLRGDTNDTMSNYTFQNNSSVQGWNVGTNGSQTNVTISNWIVRNNLGVNVPCSIPAGAVSYTVTDTYNITTSAACSSGSSPVANNNVGGATLTSLWVDYLNGNLDLNSTTTIAEHAGDPGNCLPVDIHGGSRGLPCTIGDNEPVSSGTGGSGLTSNPGLSGIVHITSDGQTRAYKTYTPAGLTCTAPGCPLIVFAQDAPGNSCFSSQATYDLFVNCDLGTSTAGPGEVFNSNWTAEADAVGAIIAYPEGYPNTCFNAPNGPPSCQVWRGNSGHDPVFISDMINQIETSSSIGANINTSKVYLAGYFAGTTSVVAKAECQVPTSAVPSNPNNDWSGIASLFAGFALEAGGELGVAQTNIASPACNWTAAGKPTIQITSKGDTSFPFDDARTGAANFECSAVTAGSACFVRAGSGSAAAYQTKWGCSAPTTTTVTTSLYTSYTKKDYGGCSSGAYEWISLGTTTGNSPPHQISQYNAMVNMPALIWAFWSSH